MKRLYSRNLAAIKERAPEIAQAIDKAPDVGKWKGRRFACPTKSGGDVLFPHPKAIRTSRQTAQDLVSNATSLIVYSGCGAGYIPRHMAEMLPEKVHLLVHEINPSVFKAMIGKFDCTTLLSHPRVQFAIGDKANLCGMVQAHLIRHGHDVQIAHDQEQWALFPAYRQIVDEKLMPFIHDFSINYSTLATFGGLFTENIIRQFPSYLTSFGVNVLKEQYNGFPALVIGGGPSLAKNLEVLRAFKGKGVVICADTILGYLIQRGIAPDFVMSVDPQDRTFEKYKALTIPKEVALVYHPGSRHEISTTWPHDKYHSASSMGPYSWINPLLGNRHAVDQNIHCQVHMGCNLAEYMGCKPIVLVGQDLAFTDHLVHVKGGSYMEEQEEQDYVDNGIIVQDIFGQQVKTTPIFLNYRDILQQKSEDKPNTYVNCTEGGIPIPGIPNFPLQHILHSIGVGRFLQVTERRQYCHQFAPPFDSTLLREEAWRRYYELEAATKVATKIQAVLDAEMDEVTRSRRLSRLMASLKRYTEGLSLLHLIAAEEEQGYMHKVEDHIDRTPDTQERYEKQVNRARLYVAPIVTHGHQVAMWLKETLAALLPESFHVKPEQWKKWRNAQAPGPSPIEPEELIP